MIIHRKYLSRIPQPIPLSNLRHYLQYNLLGNLYQILNHNPPHNQANNHRKYLFVCRPDNLVASRSLNQRRCQVINLVHNLRDNPFRIPQDSLLVNHRHIRQNNRLSNRRCNRQVNLYRILHHNRRHILLNNRPYNRSPCQQCSLAFNHLANQRMCQVINLAHSLRDNLLFCQHVSRPLNHL